MMKVEPLDVNCWRLALRLGLSEEIINHAIDVYNVHNFIGLAQLYADVFQTYNKLVKKYGVNTYSQFKFHGFLVDKYDEIQPKCDFNTFCKIIYIDTDVQGIYQLPDMEKGRYD